MDFLFKMYFSAFSRYGQKGAEASVIVLMAPLSLNIYLLFLLIMSFIFRIDGMGGFFFLVGLAITTICTLMYLRHRYLTQERYKEIKIAYPVVNVLLGFMFFIFSIVLFSLGVYVIFSE